MAIQMTAPVVDFEILNQFDLEHIYVADKSSWGIAAERKAFIEITPPGTDKKVIAEFEKNNTSRYIVNIFNSASLYMTCVGCGSKLQALPDGIWTITVKADPSSYSKSITFLRTLQLENDIDQLYMDVFSDEDGVLENEGLIDSLNTISVTLRGAAAFIRNANYAKASSLYRTASGLVEDIKKCNDQCHTFARRLKRK